MYIYRIHTALSIALEASHDVPAKIDDPLVVGPCLLDLFSITSGS